MAWIPNVNPSELIESAWGNTIRDHVVHVFASTAERAAAIPSPSLGMTTFQTDTGRLEVWRPPANNVSGTRLWRPPVGTLLATSKVALTDINTSAGGVYDVGSIFQAVTYPFDTATNARMFAYAGFGGGTVNSRADLYQFGLAVASPQFGPVSAPAAAWALHAIEDVWGNAVNASVGFKGRVYFDAGPNIHTAGEITCSVLVHV